MRLMIPMGFLARILARFSCPWMNLSDDIFFQCIRSTSGGYKNLFLSVIKHGTLWTYRLSEVMLVRFFFRTKVPRTQTCGNHCSPFVEVSLMLLGNFLCIICCCCFINTIPISNSPCLIAKSLTDSLQTLTE